MEGRCYRRRHHSRRRHAFCPWRVVLPRGVVPASPAWVEWRAARHVPFPVFPPPPCPPSPPSPCSARTCSV